LDSSPVQSPFPVVVILASGVADMTTSLSRKPSVRGDGDVTHRPLGGGGGGGLPLDCKLHSFSPALHHLVASTINIMASSGRRRRRRRRCVCRVRKPCLSCEKEEQYSQPESSSMSGV